MLNSFISRAHAKSRLEFIVRTTILLLAATFALAQNPSNSTPASKLEPDKPGQEKMQPKPDESAAAMASLAQFNNALEGLAAKVSPAVVQILVDGYGPLHEENRTQTALIVRQHAVGSGVIVDPSGYIMTNAHVVEGAQRIRVALPLPGDSGRAVPVGRRHIIEARLIGVHKDTDLALLKIDEKDLPTLPLLTQTRPRVGQLVFAIGSPKGCRIRSPWELSAPSPASPIPKNPSPTSRPMPPSIPATAAGRWSI